MNIWIINHYAVPTKYYPLARPATFAKYLMRKGHDVTIFAASTVHNCSPCINLITDGARYKEDIVDGIHYVYVNAPTYEGNGVGRIINMLSFPCRLPGVAKLFPKPDAILAVSATPMACCRGLRLAKKYKCRAVAEVADLWPESFVAYDLISKQNPLLRLMYEYEKHMYAMADAVVFTMEGGAQYIRDSRWDTEHGGPVDMGKIYHINNGVDLEQFDYNREHFVLPDADLDDKGLFTAVYCGSIRLANEVDKLVDVAQILQRRGESGIKLLLWGAGDQVEAIQRKIDAAGVRNIELKGRVGKEYIPSILSRGNLNIYMLADTPLFRYGLSLNKSFEYFASGKPVLSGRNSGYSLIDRYSCGVCLEEYTPEAMAEEIIGFAHMPKDRYDAYCANARRAAEDYDFKVLTDKLLNVMGEE